MSNLVAEPPSTPEEKYKWCDNCDDDFATEYIDSDYGDRNVCERCFGILTDDGE